MLNLAINQETDDNTHKSQGVKLERDFSLLLT